MKRERQILGNEGLGGREGNEVGSCWPRWPPYSSQAQSRAGLWRPRRAPLPCLPSQQVAERQNTSTEQKGEGRGTQVLGQRFGKGWFDWIWLGEREGISDEAALGEPLTLVLDHSPQIYTSICQSWHDAGLGSSAPPTWGVQGEMGWRLRALEVERSPPASPFPQARKVEDTSKAAPIPAWPEARNTGLPRGGCGPGPG